MTLAECTNLTVRRSFDEYVNNLPWLPENTLNVTELGLCRSEICLALWGDGNPDISGIGMIVSYFMQQAIGVVVVVGVITSLAYSLNSRSQRLWKQSLASFENCSVFFAFSFQIAAIVLLVREDFGISTAGMGDATARITQAVSVLVLMPLLYLHILPALVDLNAAEGQESEAPTKGSKETGRVQPQDGFVFLVVSWLLALYPFYSKMQAIFGPSKISEGQRLTPAEFDKIETMCSINAQPTTSLENGLMAALELLAFVPMSIWVCSRILIAGLKKHNHGSSLLQYVAISRQKPYKKTLHRVVGVFGLVYVFFTASGLLWTILRIRRYQREVTMENSTSYQDDSWGFGQIVAIAIFLPIIMDLRRVYLQTKAK